MCGIYSKYCHEHLPGLLCVIRENISILMVFPCVWEAYSPLPLSGSNVCLLEFQLTSEPQVKKKQCHLTEWVHNVPLTAQHSQGCIVRSVYTETAGLYLFLNVFNLYKFNCICSSLRVCAFLMLYVVVLNPVHMFQLLKTQMYKDGTHKSSGPSLQILLTPVHCEHVTQHANVSSEYHAWIKAWVLPSGMTSISTFVDMARINWWNCLLSTLFPVCTEDLCLCYLYTFGYSAVESICIP